MLRYYQTQFNLTNSKAFSDEKQQMPFQNFVNREVLRSFDNATLAELS